MKPWDPILDYWFADGRSTREFWFQRSDDTDAEIAARFGDLLADAGQGALDDWADTARGRLALIILMDQFSRNIHRDSGRAYALDHEALALARDGIERGMDQELSVLERWFFYMPFQHAEDMAAQDQSVRLFEQLLRDAPPEHEKICEIALDYARRHRAVIEAFGRYPHRNEVLGRTSSEQELAHLATGNWF